ncbi:MAG: glycosyltransferase [Bacteroidales bacterium]|nr:glycosyltransferase [Bacteroidales bacterium]MBN2764193.1 glycosyltransferase [Bacteroidales bacterium]
MIDLSVIIVNYNVRFFLEQCLHSVYKSIHNINAEVIVVDNNSVDRSCQMIREKFPDVILIENKVNAGFSRANNQAIRKARGRYVLLLNPDTVVQEDTFSACIQFMDSHPDAGCLGVKMIDGKGNFLPESKRGLPTPQVAFYKIFGLSALFPNSPKFGRYHLGFLDKDKIHQVDVISGAFMFLRKSVLDRTGLLDEDFFMYGEDIDISYRITQAGFKNYYFPETTIIHYKGESTKKSSINYVIVFYNAMAIFAQKHFSKNMAQTYNFLIHLAIYFRAAFSILRRFFLTIINPVLNAAAIYAGYKFFLPVWESSVFGKEGYYPDTFIHIVVPVYILIWLLSVYFSGGYEKMVRGMDLIKGILLGTLAILIIYALLPESFRFSRALIIMGTVWVIFSAVGIRFLLSLADKSNFKFGFFRSKKHIIIIGTEEEGERVYSILRQTRIKPELIGYVSPDESCNNLNFLGSVSMIEEIVKIHKVDELIFCAKDMTSRNIISTMLKFTNAELDFKIAPPESLSVIGSNSINTAGDLYVVHFNTLSMNLNRRKKRILDFLLSILFLAVSPLTAFFVIHPGRFIKNIFTVLFGIHSWVGYHPVSEATISLLPRLRPGILTPVCQLESTNQDRKTVEKINMLYAKDYSIWNDLIIIWKGLRQLGSGPNNIIYSSHNAD